MGFGNPYNDPWSIDIIDYWLSRMLPLGIRSLQLSDTIGIASPEKITEVFEFTSNQFPTLDIGVHLHTRPEDWLGKMDAAYKAGCRKFDGALLGFGGCPMAKDDLVGNMPMENMIKYVEGLNEPTHFDTNKLEEAIEMARRLYHVTTV